jgi:hypothetical protein
MPRLLVVGASTSTPRLFEAGALSRQGPSLLGTLTNLYLCGRGQPEIDPVASRPDFDIDHVVELYYFFTHRSLLSYI